MIRMRSCRVVLAIATLLAISPSAFSQIAPDETIGGGVGLRTTGAGVPGGRVTTATTIPQTYLPSAGVSPGIYSPGTQLSIDPLGRITSATPGFTPTASGFAVAYYASAAGSGTACTLASPCTLAQCQTNMQAQASTGIKTCYARAGRYVLSAGLSLGASDTGETWSCFPPDGLNSCIIDGSSLVSSTISLQINTSASPANVTINGFTFVGNTYLPVAVGGGESNIIFTNNIIDGGGVHGQPMLGGFYAFASGTLTNLLFAGNTIQNIGGQSNDNQEGIRTNQPITNSLIFNNTFQCIAGFGIRWVAAGSGNNIIAYNKFTGMGNAGGQPPSCLGTNIQGNGEAVGDEGGSTNQLYLGNYCNFVEAYCIVAAGKSVGPFFISDNNMTSVQTTVDLIGGANGSSNTNANGVVRRNTLNATGSILITVGDDNNTCPRDSTANAALVNNNTLLSYNSSNNSGYESIYLTHTQNSIIQGNVGFIGTNTVSGTGSNHQPAGVMVPAWQADASCTVTANSTGNLLQLNSFTQYSANAANAKYGVFVESNQAPNTVQFNILYPFGTSGTAAIQNNSGGTITDLNNQKAVAPLPFAGAPPIADAGPSQLVLSGQTGIVLNGSLSRNLINSAGVICSPSVPLPCQATTASYSWSQILGTSVTLSSTTAQTPTFVAPVVTQPTILGFKLVVSNAFGSTYDQVYIGVVPQI